MKDLSHVQLHLVESMEDIRLFHQWLSRSRRVLGVDTETTGLSPEIDRVRLIQFGDLEEGWAIPWLDYRGIALEALDRYDHDLVLHNSKYDIRMISTNSDRSVTEWPWHRSHDTMGMAHILDSQRTKGLKSLAAKYINPNAVSGQSSLHDGMKQHKWGWENVPIKYPPYWQYAALDPVLTCYLYQEFEPQISGEYRRLYDLEMAAIRVAAKMEENGVQVDLAYSRRKADELRGYSESARDYLNERYGIVNPTPAQLTQFFRAAQVPMIDKTTASGNQAMDKEVLQSIDHEVARITLAIRKAEKLAGTYLENFPPLADADDRIHPNIFTMGARTGRMSITEPALQTLPRKDPTVRRAFLPSEGHALLSCDYDQIEARLTAHFSQDPGLISAFHSDQDFFCYVASMLFGREIKKGMRERDLIKGVVYGKIYGASVPKMAATAGVDVLQMKTVNDLFENTFSGVPKTMGEIIGVGKLRRIREGRGYVITPFGRKLYADEGKEYTLVNYLIQCHASEILKDKMVALDAALPNEVKMLLPIHDEIVFDVPVGLVDETRGLIESTMSASDYAVPVTASSDVMYRSWADKYE